MYLGYEQLPPIGDEKPAQLQRKPVIRTARPADVERVTATLVAGCGEMPLCQWLAPKVRHRRGVMTGYCRILVTHLLAYGRVEVVDGERLPLAVAGWLPSNAPAAPAGYAQQVARATAPWTDRFRPR